MDVSSIVLAGGKGLRLGRGKAFESVGNRSLLQRVVSCLSLFDADIIIVTAAPLSLDQLIDYPKLKGVTDIYPGKGPLGGVYTGLTLSNSYYNFVVACDLPFLNLALLRYMIQVSAGFDLVVPREGNYVQPLHAVYSKGCLTFIEDMLKRDNLSITALLPLAKVRYVESDEIDRFDPRHLSFFNVNTKRDLETARELAKEETNHDKY